MIRGYPEVDRRRFRRWIIEGSAILSITDEQGESVVVNDICPLGAGIFCNHFIEVGTQLDIEINYFFDKVVKKKAKVIWCKQVDQNFWAVGLSFGLNDLLEFDKPQK